MKRGPEAELWRLREIAIRAFVEVFDPDDPEWLESMVELTARRPAAWAGREWGIDVGYGEGLRLVFLHATAWKFNRRVANALYSIFDEVACMDRLLALLSGVIEADDRSALAHVASAQFAAAKACPPWPLEPVLELQAAFRAVERARDLARGRLAEQDLVPPSRIYRETCSRWIDGVIDGYLNGMLETLAYIVSERFGPDLAERAQDVLEGRIDRFQAATLAGLLTEVTEPVGVRDRVVALAFQEPLDTTWLDYWLSPPAEIDPDPWRWLRGS